MINELKQKTLRITTINEEYMMKMKWVMIFTFLHFVMIFVSDL